MARETLPISRVVRRDEVPESGLDVSLAPDERQRHEMARFLDVPAVEEMAAQLTVTPHGRSGLRVRGTVRGQVTQTCVVTLEPVAGRIDESVDTIYAPADSPVLNIELTPEELASEESDIEPMRNGSIDLGGLVMEHVALGLEPYPRKEGVEFEEKHEDSPPPSPFAKLSTLKDEPGKA